MIDIMYQSLKLVLCSGTHALFWSGTPSPLVTLVDTGVIHVINGPGFPSLFLHTRRPRNEANTVLGSPRFSILQVTGS